MLTISTAFATQVNSRVPLLPFLILTVNCDFLGFFFFKFINCFYDYCFFLEKENLCLYGHPSESWEVTLPAEEVPPELPEPALGINFARDGMKKQDWLSLVAVHSDSWLMSVSFYFGARFNKNERYALIYTSIILQLSLLRFLSDFFAYYLSIILLHFFLSFHRYLIPSLP